MIRELRSAGIVGVVGAILNPHDSTATVAYIPSIRKFGMGNRIRRLLPDYHWGCASLQ